MAIEIRIQKNGGPEVMECHETKLNKSGPDEGFVRIKQSAIGVNYIDTYHRSGIYPVKLPCVLGMEAVGKITSVGSGVEGFGVGERVGYASIPIGAYCEERDYPAVNVVKIPDFIDDPLAASILLKGMTVEYLFNRVRKLKAGDFVLFHAAAGGVGLIACQWARSIGVKLIGTVGSEEKAVLAKTAGCNYVINYKTENVSEKVGEITKGVGVPVVYDGVGKDTFLTTLDCLSDRGLFVSFGQSSGMIENVNLHSTFAPKNLFYTRPSLIIYNKKREELDKSSATLFNLIKRGEIKIENQKKYKLIEAPLCHKDLQSRKTVGSLVLVP